MITRRSDAVVAPASGVQPCQVVHLALSAQPQAPEFEAGFDQLLGELQAQPDTAAALADGLRWVGQQFYGQTHTLAGLRLAAGLSQRQLALQCGIEQPHVSRYESGRHEPGLSMAGRMAAALGVSLEALLSAWHNTHQQNATAGQP